jgi:methyl-accepting chemotaxis protein
MVESIQQETANTTNAVEASRTSIGTGKQRTEEAQQMLTQIINRANHTEQLTEGTVTAAGAQSSASKQIGDHAAQVAQLAAASLDASEQAAHTGENIHTLAKQLTHIVQQFRI